MNPNFLSSDASSENVVDITMKEFPQGLHFRRTLREKDSDNKVMSNLLVDIISGTMFKCSMSQLTGLRRTFNNAHNPLFYTRLGNGYTGRAHTYVVSSERVIDQAEILAGILEEDKELLIKIAENIPANYHEFTIPKRNGGVRKICAPNEDLKRIQRKILDIYLEDSRVTQFAHGFCNGRSIKTNAEVHLGAKVLVKMDMSNFFDNATEQMVVATLVRTLNKHDDRIMCVGLVSKLCTLHGTTPQGSPTSPKLTNLICFNMDLSLVGLANKHNAKFTRYADDIIFSSIENLQINNLIPIISQIVSAFGFQINRNKTGVFRSGGRLPVTGIVVNERLNVPRRKRMELRAKMHHILVGRITRQQVEEQNLLQKIQGYVAFITMANPQQGERFKALFERVKAHLSQ